MLRHFAEFWFWTQQWLNRTQLLCLGLTKTPEVSNTSTVGNSLSIPTVHHTAPIGWRFTSYDCRKLDRSAETEIWADYTFWYKSGFWQNLAMTIIETLNMKNSANELSFPLVTYTTNSNARFGNYGLLMSGQCAELILGRLDRRMNNQVLRAEYAGILTRVVNEFRRPLTQLSNAYSNTRFQYPQQQLPPFEHSLRAELADCRKTKPQTIEI
jgi:hypothetical protein